jgi:hypothetical protein
MKAILNRRREQTRSCSGQPKNPWRSAHPAQESTWSSAPATRKLQAAAARKRTRTPHKWRNRRWAVLVL